MRPRAFCPFSSYSLLPLYALQLYLYTFSICFSTPLKNLILKFSSIQYSMKLLETRRVMTEVLLSIFLSSFCTRQLKLYIDSTRHTTGNSVSFLFTKKQIMTYIDLLFWWDKKRDPIYRSWFNTRLLLMNMKEKWKYRPGSTGNWFWFRLCTDFTFFHCSPLVLCSILHGTDVGRASIRLYTNPHWLESVLRV